MCAMIITSRTSSYSIASGYVREREREKWNRRIREKKRGREEKRREKSGREEREEGRRREEKWHRRRERKSGREEEKRKQDMQARVEQSPKHSLQNRQAFPPLCLKTETKEKAEKMWISAMYSMKLLKLKLFFLCNSER